MGVFHAESARRQQGGQLHWKVRQMSFFMWFRNTDCNSFVFPIFSLLSVPFKFHSDKQPWPHSGALYLLIRVKYLGVKGADLNKIFQIVLGLFPREQQSMNCRRNLYLCFRSTALFVSNSFPHAGSFQRNVHLFGIPCRFYNPISRSNLACCCCRFLK